VTLCRTAEAVAMALDGRVAARLPAPLAAGRRLYRLGLETTRLQPTEAVWFTDDFTAAGALSNAWQVREGTWALTGQTPAISRTPGFALRGERGLISAGSWCWSNYGLTFAAQADTATAVVCQIGRWDADNALELRLTVGSPGTATLLERRGGQLVTLAAAAANAPAHQWLKVRLAPLGGQVVAELDGKRLLAAAAPPRLGALALGAEGGAALFDDVEAADADLPPQLPQVHPATFDKGRDGLLDHDTWSAPAAAWLPCGAAGRFEHVGRFAGDLSLRLPLRPTAADGALTLHAGPERGQDAPLLTARGPGELRLTRSAGRWQASLDGRSLPVASQPGGAVCLGLELKDLALSPAEIELRAAGVAEYLFNRAPADWWQAGGQWRVASRWTCQPQWSWLAGGSQGGVAAFWHKRAVVGDVVVEAPLSVLMRGGYGEPGSEPFERLRLSVCGDGQDPWSGYTLEIGGEGQSCRLYRGKEPVAQVAGALPAWREIHNAWYDTRLERHGAQVTAWFHRRPLLTFHDPRPLSDGKVCLWTERNVLVTPYVAVYGLTGS
jgi:hypothetical protein